MMGFAIKETFRVDASVDRVWRYLVDPTQVVTCLPGAELTGDEGERIYLGKVRVKVGPVTASYAGRARLTEVNDADHVVRMEAEGREAGGAGSARLRMMSRVDAHPEGGSEVRVEAEVDVAGKIVQFGRGMIEAVSRQLFREFVVCVRASLESSAAAGAPTASGDASKPAGRSAAGGTSPQAIAGTRPGESRGTGGAPANAGPTSPPASPSKPVAVVPLVLRAIWATLTAWLSRIAGRRRTA